MFILHKTDSAFNCKMREEILAGLKNALERGESLERAVQSFINAGYNPAEVRQAAQLLSDGALSTLHPQTEPIRKIQMQSSIQNIREPAQTQPIQQVQQEKIYTPRPPAEQFPTRKLNNGMPFQPVRKKTNSGKRIAVIILILILLALIGGLVYVIIFGQEFIDRLLV